MIDDSLFVSRGPDVSSLIKEIALDAAPSAVFAALTTEEGVRRALEVPSLLDLRIGGAYEIYFDDDAPPGQRGGEGCQVLAYVPDEMLAVSWNAPPQFKAARMKRTWVVFALRPGPKTGTTLRLSHMGFGLGEEWAQVRAYFDRAWGIFLNDLAKNVR